MPNISIKVTLTGVLDLQGNDITPPGSLMLSMLLDPFYATEMDVLPVIMDNPSNEHMETVRRMIFNASIEADTLFQAIGVEMSPRDLFLLKRKFVICKALYGFAQFFFKCLLASVNKSKTLGDFQVSLNIKRDPSFLKSIADDAKACFQQLEPLVSGPPSSGAGLIASFTKGACNPCNRATAKMDWYPSNKGYPKVSIAADKFDGVCRRYKIGALSNN